MNRNRIVALFVFGWALALWPSTGSAFCTIAGNCEPTPTGKIVVTHIGKSKQPVPATFRLYPAGKPASFRHLVQTGHAGKPVELLTGKYDVLIAGNPPLWGRGVEVKSGETVSVVLGGVGGLLVAGKDSAGKPVRSGIVVYVAGAERKAANIVTTGRTNERVPIVAGVYDVRADLSPDIWFENVAVSRNEVTELGLPEPTTIRISVFDPDGKPLSEFVFIQGLDGNKVRATKQTNTEIAMSPGRYDIRVSLSPNVWFRNFEVTTGRAVNLKIPQRGRLLVRLTGNKPDEKKRYWVYPPGKKSNTVVTAHSDEPVTVAPGKYDIRMKLGAEWQIAPVEILPGKTAEVSIAVP